MEQSLNNTQRKNAVINNINNLRNKNANLRLGAAKNAGRINVVQEQITEIKAQFNEAVNALRVIDQAITSIIVKLNDLELENKAIMEILQFDKEVLEDTKNNIEGITVARDVMFAQPSTPVQQQPIANRAYRVTTPDGTVRIINSNPGINVISEVGGGQVLPVENSDDDEPTPDILFENCDIESDEDDDDNYFIESVEEALNRDSVAPLGAAVRAQLVRRFATNADGQQIIRNEYQCQVCGAKWGAAERVNTHNCPDCGVEISYE